MTRHTEITDLMPCPLCGGDAYLANVEMAGCSYIVCTDCHLQTDDGSRERVVRKWNTRVLAALIADAERRGREAGLVEAANLASMWFQFSSQGEPTGGYCTVEAHDPGGMVRYIKRDAILALRTSPAEPSDTVVSVTAQEAAKAGVINAVINADDMYVSYGDGCRINLEFKKEHCDAFHFHTLRVLAGASK